MNEEEYKIRKQHLLDEMHAISKTVPAGRKRIEDPKDWQAELQAITKITELVEELQELEDAYKLGISLDELEHETGDDIAYEDQD